MTSPGMTLLPVRSIDRRAGRRRDPRGVADRGDVAVADHDRLILARRAPVPSITRACVERDDRRLDLDVRRERVRGRLLREGRPEGLRYEHKDDEPSATAVAQAFRPARPTRPTCPTRPACPSRPASLAPPPPRSRRDRPGRAPWRSHRPSPWRCRAARSTAGPPAASSISRMSLRAIVSSKLALKSPRAIFSPRDLISPPG